MSQIVVSSTAVERLLEWIEADLLDGAELRLFRAGFAPTPESALGDFPESQFPGYAPVELTEWDAPQQIEPGLWQFTHPDVLFTATGASAEYVHGYYLSHADGFFVLAQARPFPLPIGTAGFTEVVRPRVRFHLPLPSPS